MLNRKIKTERLSQEQEFALAERFRCSGDLGARNALVMANIGLVHFMVGQMLRGYFRYDDLLHEGVLGLIRATESFEANRNLRFSTYAAFWIRAKIQTFMHAHEKEFKVDDVRLSIMAPEDQDNPEQQALESEKTSRVRSVFEQIIQELKNPKLEIILERRILADEPESLEELGRRLDISRETCRLLERKMLKLAKEQLANWRD